MYYIIITVLLMQGCMNDTAFSATMPNYQVINNQKTCINEEKLANAIFKAENSKAWPYGIKHHYKHTTARQACLNTIRHAERRYKSGDFIVFLGQTYSPPSINPNWARMVKYFYNI